MAGECMLAVRNTACSKRKDACMQGDETLPHAALLAASFTAAHVCLFWGCVWSCFPPANFGPIL